MAKRAMFQAVESGVAAVVGHALPLATVALLLAAGPAAAQECLHADEKGYSNSQGPSGAATCLAKNTNEGALTDLEQDDVVAPELPITVERLPDHAALDDTDFVDVVTSVQPFGLNAKVMLSDDKPLVDKYVPIDPITEVGLYQNTRLVNGVMDSMGAIGPFLFEVQNVGETWWGDEIRAVHVRVPMEWPARPDDAERPTLLVECNMHSREWLAMESCTRFLERLFAAYVYYPWQTLYFMQHVNLYVIPVTNPDGRNVDDHRFWEDPTTPWSNPTLCYSDDFWHANNVYGWRQNVQPVSCDAHPFVGFNLGIDLARNFSRGWTSGSSDCMGSQFRGEYPFQAPEAAALRRFVNNRTVSMSVHVHSFASRFEVPSELNAEVTSMRDGFIYWWNKTLDQLSAADYPVVELKSDGATGGGVGQFSGWVSGQSNVAGQLDRYTRRGINAFLLELPPDCANSTQCPNPYYGSAYYAGSNAFHPSAPAIIEDVAPAFIAAMAFFVKQAQYPWCAVNYDTFAPGSCSDIGLTGSKIAADTHEIGVLDWVDTGTESYEMAPPGSYGAVYRIQNFDTGAPVTVDVRVEVASKPFASSSYTVEHVFTKTHDLPAGGSGVGEAADSLFAYTSGLDYRVTVRILNDDLADNEGRNDKHVFKFRVP